MAILDDRVRFFQIFKHRIHRTANLLPEASSSQMFKSISDVGVQPWFRGSIGSMNSWIGEPLLGDINRISAREVRISSTKTRRSNIESLEKPF